MGRGCAVNRDDELSRNNANVEVMPMTDFTWIIGVIVNLVGVLFIVMQIRVALERRISTLETYVKMLIRDRGINVRASDNVDDLEQTARRGGL
jgi:hypothetical protein